MTIKKKLLTGCLAAIVLIAGLLVFAFTHRTIRAEYSDPSGNYTVQVSYRTFYSFIPMAPGSSSDKPAYVEIFRKDGESMGRIPVPMLQLAAVKWLPNGAEVELVGEWDFANGRCYYWSEEQDVKIYVKGAAPVTK